MNTEISFTSALLVGLGEASQRVIDPGMSSTVGVSSASMLADGSSIASLNNRSNFVLQLLDIKQYFNIKY